MIKRIKQALGIEGIKVRIDCPVEHEASAKVIKGVLEFSTKNEQAVNSVILRFIETYKRGRRKNKRIDDYLLGEWFFEEAFTVSPDEPYRLPFELEFDLLQSGVEKFQSKNLIFKGIGEIAKLAKNASSIYTLAAEVKVQGTAFNPRSEKEVYFL